MVNESVAHITLVEGEGEVRREVKIQVLNAEGTDWDEAATQAAVAEYLAKQAAATKPPG